MRILSKKIEMIAVSTFESTWAIVFDAIFLNICDDYIITHKYKKKSIKYNLFLGIKNFLFLVNQIYYN